MILYSFDPGKTTGYAVWELSDIDFVPFGMPSQFGELSMLQLHVWLTDLFPPPLEDVVFIYEDYKIRNDKKHKGFNHNFNSGETLRAIGAIELRAHQLGIRCIPQRPDQRKVGAGYAGMPHDPNKHDKDHISAIKHGYVYLVDNRIMKPRSKNA